MNLSGDVVTEWRKRIAVRVNARKHGGEGGIRTLGTGVSPYNGLANRRIRPLCHLSGVGNLSVPRREEATASIADV